MVFLSLLVATFKHRGASLHLLSCTPRLLTLLLHLCVLRVYPADDIEECLIVHGQYTVCMVYEHVQS